MSILPFACCTCPADPSRCHRTGQHIGSARQVRASAGVEGEIVDANYQFDLSQRVDRVADVLSALELGVDLGLSHRPILIHAYQ